MRARHRTVILMFAVGCASRFAQSSPLFDSKEAPVPPAQTQPWTPPRTELAPIVVSAVTELFREGLADPRGCEYREIEIAESKTWRIKTHGWVLPGKGGEQRYAIGWNGVVYPVASVGGPVDLQKEFSVMPTAYGARRFRGNGNGWPMSDQGSLSADSALPIKTAFLLRLGETQLAEEVCMRVKRT
jgi:hypothetical protein